MPYRTTVKRNTMKKNTINKEYATHVLKENYAYYRRNGGHKDITTLREYVETQEETDPGYFRWLFNNDDLNDFADLTDEQKKEYQNFLNEL